VLADQDARSAYVLVLNIGVLLMTLSRRPGDGGDGLVLVATRPDVSGVRESTLSWDASRSSRGSRASRPAHGPVAHLKRPWFGLTAMGRAERLSDSPALAADADAPASPRYRCRVANGTVVVTGASTGIGAATCRHLAGLGFDVLAGVRREEDAARVESWSVRVRAQRLDVTEPDQVAALATAVATAPSPLCALVNNAGIAVVGPVEALTVEDWRQQLEVNVLGQVSVTRTLLPRLINARGRIVMMSSIGGLVAGPLFGPYSASKFAIEALTDVLRQEVGPLGVRVVAIEPGAIATPIWERGRLAGDARWAGVEPEVQHRYVRLVDAVRALADQGSRDGLPAEDVALVVGRALTAQRPRTRYLVGRDAVTQAWLSRLLPDRAMDALVRRAVFGD